MITNTYAVRVLLLIIAFCFSTSGWAQNKDDVDPSIRPLPVFETLDVQTFTAQSSEIIKEVIEDPLLNYRINLQNDYTQKPYDTLKNETHDGRLYGTVFEAYGPSTAGNGRPHIRLISEKIDRAIAIDHWLKIRALDNQYTLRSYELGETGQDYDAFYVRLDDLGQSEAVRERGFLNENRIVRFEFSIPIKMWNQQKDIQIHTVKSFAFLNKYDVLIPEGEERYSFLGSLSLNHPKSWRFSKIESNHVNEAKASFVTADYHNFIFGKIEVATTSETSLSDAIDQTIYPVDLPHIIDDIKMTLLKNGIYETSKLIERVEVPLAFETNLNITEVYAIRKSNSDDYLFDQEKRITHELWLSVIKSNKDNKQQYVVGMLIPSRDVNFKQWALGSYAYKSMVNSLK